MRNIADYFDAQPLRPQLIYDDCQEWVLQAAIILRFYLPDVPGMAFIALLPMSIIAFLDPGNEPHVALSSRTLAVQTGKSSP